MGRSITTRRGRLPSAQVWANDGNLTQFSALVPLIRFISEKLDVVRRLDQVVGRDSTPRLYSRHVVLWAFVVGALGGIQRLAHLEWLRDHAVLLKFLRLPRWPVRKVFSSALAGLTDCAVPRLVSLVADIGLEPLRGHESAVIDMDSSAVVALGRQEGALFGYSGKGRNRRRHHPLVASIAETRMVVHADYRDGSAIRSEEAISFAAQAIATVRAGLAKSAKVTLRADSGFWTRPFASWLLDNGILFIFAIPPRAGVKLMLHNTRWRGLDGDADTQVAVIRGERLGWTHASMSSAVVAVSTTPRPRHQARPSRAARAGATRPSSPP